MSESKQNHASFCNRRSDLNSVTQFKSLQAHDNRAEYTANECRRHACPGKDQQNFQMILRRVKPSQRNQRRGYGGADRDSASDREACQRGGCQAAGFIVFAQGVKIGDIASNGASDSKVQ